MRGILYFIETTLLWMVAIFFLTGLIWRIFFFVFNIFKRRTFSRFGSLQRCSTLLGAWLPFHRAALKKPVYAAIRYAFHACLIIVPVWYSGHIYLWEESRFEWYWTPLPDSWADGMTLSVLAVCAFFLFRRMVLKNRLKAKASDCILILITAAPFLTGYFLTHGHLDSIPFFENYLWYLHVVSGEIMLAVIVFLFCRTCLQKETCVGCAACVENCPCETLEFDDQGASRVFRYSHYQCICCGSCVNVCPENAAVLRHVISIKHLFQVLSKDVIRSVDLAACARCGAAFAPKPQVAKLGGIFSAHDAAPERLSYCDRCKKLSACKSPLFPDAWETVLRR